MSKINTVIFDIGNVLVDFDWHNFVKKSLPDASEATLAKIHIAVWGDNRWDGLDLGKDPESVFQDMVAHAPDCEKELRLLFDNLGGCVGHRASSIPWLKELKARGLKLLYLSNYSHIAMEKNPGVLDFMPLMDGGVFSCDIHVIKPDRAIYACIAEKYDLIPERCVFIDDLQANIDGAIDFGFHGIRLLTIEQAQSDLNKLLEA